MLQRGPAGHAAGIGIEHIGLSQGRVSAHLACLAGCGYVQVRRAGRFAYYMVADPRVADLVREHLLAFPVGAK